jgi:F-type H+-transporting ATPase subunit gamma
MLPGKRAGALDGRTKRQTVAGAIGAVVFGSDQGLVGQFNDVVADYAVKTLAALPGKPEVWAVGERVHARLADAGLPLVGLFAVPNSVKAITPLVGQILVESEARHGQGEVTELHLFYNRPTSGRVMRPSVSDCYRWTKTGGASWPIFPGRRGTCPRSWVAAPRPCGRSSANIFSSRSSGRAPNPLRARTRAAWRRCNAPTKNIDELLEDLNRTFHRLRQNGIDEELFDVVSGFEALSVEKK